MYNAGAQVQLIHATRLDLPRGIHWHQLAALVSLLSIVAKCLQGDRAGRQI